MEKEMKFCQSCAMPLGEDDTMYGTEKDGTKNPDYCSYCYADGDFTADITMDQMIDFCVKPMVEANPSMSQDEARKSMEEFFPKLKRWTK